MDGSSAYLCKLMMIVIYQGNAVLKEILLCMFSGTFKLKKLALQKEGFDRGVIKDALYFLDGKRNQYVELTPELFAQISNGKAGL